MLIKITYFNCFITSAKKYFQIKNVISLHINKCTLIYHRYNLSYKIFITIPLSFLIMTSIEADTLQKKTLRINMRNQNCSHC